MVRSLNWNNEDTAPSINTIRSLIKHAQEVWAGQSFYDGPMNGVGTPKPGPPFFDFIIAESEEAQGKGLERTGSPGVGLIGVAERRKQPT